MNKIAKIMPNNEIFSGPIIELNKIISYYH